MTAGPVELIRATSAHAAGLALIHEHAFPPKQRWDADAFARLIATLGVCGWIAADGQGFILARAVADEAEILTVAVLPGSRRLGLATALLGASEIWAAESGAVAMFLEVAADNDPAIALYCGRGWREVGRRRRYYFDGQDAIVLRKDLMLSATGAV